MHLHGHDFWLVADDGNELPSPLRMTTLRVAPGKTNDIILEGYNPGYWTFHDHDTSRVTNNGLYPGGMLTVVAYEGVKPAYLKVALDE